MRRIRGGDTIRLWARPIGLSSTTCRRDGFIEGRNLIVDLELSNQDLNALVAQAGDMAGADPDVLVALGAESGAAPTVWMNTSHSVPIVFVAINFDPIAGGYVQSLAKPAGNVAGVFLRQPELAEEPD